MKKAILFTCAALVLFAACKKSDDNNGGSGNNTSKRRDTLTTGKWLTTATTLTTNFFGKDSTFDTYTTLSDCQKDNLTIFNANDSLYIDEGATKCNTGDPQVSNQGTWSLTGDSVLALNTGLNLDGIYKISSFSNTAFSAQRDSTLSGTPVYFKFRITFSHQN